MAEILKETAHAVPYDGGAQVTHVHLLCDVWRGEVDDYLKKKQKKTTYIKETGNGGTVPCVSIHPSELFHITQWTETDFVWINRIIFAQYSVVGTHHYISVA